MRTGISTIFCYTLFFPNPVGGNKPPSLFFIQNLVTIPSTGLVVEGAIGSGWNNSDFRGLLWEALSTPQGTNRLSSLPQRDFSGAFLVIFISNTASTDTKFLFVTKDLLSCYQKVGKLSSSRLAVLMGKRWTPPDWQISWYFARHLPIPMGFGCKAWAPPGSFLEMQNVRPHPWPGERESAF